MKNINDIKDCFGCGVCTMACARNLIKIRQNEDGFYEPFITDFAKCNDCSLCLSVCSYKAEDVALKKDCLPQSFAAWSKEHAVRRKCSSGGVGFEIGRYLLTQGYKVCAVRFNADKNQAEHYIATTVEELIPSIGSKYIQSNSFEGLRQIDKKQKYLVTGTPCQVDSFRRFIKKFRCEDNFILMDFFCHGVPSKLMWDKYVEEVEKKVGKIKYVSWRNKFTGWHDSWAMAIDGAIHGEPVIWKESYNLLIRGKKSFLNSRLSQGDMFYKMFLSNSCLNKPCYNNCRFKYNHSSADIRIGDMWGKEYAKNEDGVSGVVAFTAKGLRILMASNCELIEHSFEVVAAGQMKSREKCPPTRKYVMKALKEGKLSLAQIYNKYQKPYKFLMLPLRIFKKLKRVIA